MAEGFPLKRLLQVIGLRAEFDAGDIFQAQIGAVGIRANDNVAELFRRRQDGPAREPCR